MILNYPDINSLLAKDSYAMTFLKWVSLVVIVIQILYMIIASKRKKMTEICTHQR